MGVDDGVGAVLDRDPDVLAAQGALGELALLPLVHDARVLPALSVLHAEDAAGAHGGFIIRR